MISAICWCQSFVLKWGSAAGAGLSWNFIWFLRVADVGSVSRPKSSALEPFGSKHGGLETAATSLD